MAHCLVKDCEFETDKMANYRNEFEAMLMHSLNHIAADLHALATGPETPIAATMNMKTKESK